MFTENTQSTYAAAVRGRGSSSSTADSGQHTPIPSVPFNPYGIQGGDFPPLQPMLPASYPRSVQRAGPSSTNAHNTNTYSSLVGRGYPPFNATSSGRGHQSTDPTPYTDPIPYSNQFAFSSLPSFGSVNRLSNFVHQPKRQQNSRQPFAHRSIPPGKSAIKMGKDGTPKIKSISFKVELVAQDTELDEVVDATLRLGESIRSVATVEASNVTVLEVRSFVF